MHFGDLTTIASLNAPSPKAVTLTCNGPPFSVLLMLSV